MVSLKESGTLLGNMMEDIFSEASFAYVLYCYLNM